MPKAHEALNIWRKTQYERCTSELLCSTGDVLEGAGDLTGAEQLYRQSEESSTRSKDRSGILASRLSLAKLLIDQANFTGAEQLTRTTLQAFRDESTETSALSLLTVLARSLLAQGKAAEAGEVVRQAEAASRSVKDRCSSLSLSIVEASLRASSGAPKDVDESVKALSDLSNLASKASCFPVSLDARLAEGEIEAHSGPKAAGRTHLAALQTESKRKGFQLIASQASKALLWGDKRPD